MKISLVSVALRCSILVAVHKELHHILGVPSVFSYQKFNIYRYVSPVW